MKFWTTCVLLIVSAFSASSAHAHQGPAIAAPDELFNQSKWAEAAAAYSEVVAQQPANGPAWQNLGESLLQQHKDTEAAAAFERAIAIPYRPVLNRLNLARTYADAKDRSKSLAELQKVFDSGYGGQLRPLVISSPEFAVWKDDPEFTALVEKMAPCRGPEFRKFDFWIGDWDVHAPDGGPTVGHNLVTLEQDGCLLLEHWTASTGGQTGTSFNYYDVRDKKWHQLYLDNSGNAGAFPAMAGDLVGNKMVLLTDDTKSPLSRWTWYVLAPGKVRQMAEQSTDGGKTWTIGWDSVYIKQK
jgi:tetratricopeptide (TPR) repeat protein